MILSVDGIDFSYNSHPVLRGVSFELPRGCVCGILGVNGAGKSTILKCLNRVLKPRAGVVYLEGKDLLEMRRSRVARHVGYVPQNNEDQPLTVFDTVLLGRKPYIKWAPRERDLAIVEKLLKTMHLEHLALRPANRLSGGELQKVTIARALAQEPDILLMDEPTSNLDLKNQLAVMDLVTRTVEREGLSAVVTLHDINLAFRYADYFLMLKDGAVYSFSPRAGVTPEMIREVYGVDVILSRVLDQTCVVPLERQSL